MTSLDYSLITATLLIVILGGTVAYLKGDFITRGMAITFFTSIWGLVAIIISRRSNARSGDIHDSQWWPPYSWLAVGGTLLTLLAITLVRRLISASE